MISNSWVCNGFDLGFWVVFEWFWIGFGVELWWHIWWRKVCIFAMRFVCFWGMKSARVDGVFSETF